MVKYEKFKTFLNILLFREVKLLRVNWNYALSPFNMKWQAFFRNTRLFRRVRPSSISIVNMFSLYTLYNKNKHNFADSIKKNSKITFWWRQIFENSVIHKLSLGSHKIRARSVQSFWRLLDTKKQTDKQSIYVDCLDFLSNQNILYIQFVYESQRDSSVPLKW